MEKIIKRTISLTTKKRDSRNKLFEEFYSHDKNTATFEFTVEGGIPTEDIVVLFHFKRTNRHFEVHGRVDNDKIIVNFDTSLIVKDEQVAGYIYYENGDKSNDVYRFMFDVYVSEIDKEHDLPVMEQESKRIVPLTDIVTKSEITELLKKIVANEKLYDDTEIKQQIDLKADKEAVQAISSKVQALEIKADNDTVYNDSELRGQIATKADTQTVEAIARRVETLEGKPDNDTIYNDTELREKIESKADKEALLQYLLKSELTPISEKVQSIETNIGRMATQQQLESYVSKNELEQKGYLTSEDTHNFALKSEIPEVPNLDAINEKIRELAEKPSVDLSHLATKKEIEDSHYLTREDINGLATNSKVEAVESRVQQLENKPPVDLSNLATKHEIEDVVKTAELTQVTERVQHLEARPQIDASTLVTKDELDKKGYLTTAPDLSEYAKKSEIPPQFDSQPLTERINALEAKAIANGAYNDQPLLDKIHEVQERLKGFITQSSRYLVEHQSLAHLVTKDELARMGYLNAHQSLEHLVTKGELENKHYLTNQDITNLATNTKVEAVETRVQTLENKPPVDLSNLATKQELEAVRNSQPTVDTSNLVTKQELEDKHYLSSVPEVDTSHFVTRDELDSKHYVQDVSNLATNAKVDAVEARVQIIENKPAVDLSPFVTKQELEAKQYLNNQSLDGYVKKSELPPQVDTSTLVSKQELTSMNLVNAEALGEVSKKMLEQKTKITALEEKAGYEIHGTGMPNGRVTAPIGTTYVDTAVTNGALKWIKESGDGDRGWKVFTGDTGWRTLNIVSKLGSSMLQVRRVNNMVTYNFGGLSWGWFGIVRRNGQGYVAQGTDYERNCFILQHNQIPTGFRTPNSLIGPIYNDRGAPYGTWYIGNPSDDNHLRFQFLNPIPTDSDIGDIRVSSISYYTDEDWPTVLP